MVSEEASRKGGAVEVSNLGEKKKGRELRESFHELNPLNTTKDQSPLLCTAACKAKAASQITTDLAEIEKKSFLAGFALTLPATQ